MILAGENQRTQRKTCPSATLSTTNHTWIDLGANLGLHDERPATNRLCNGTAIFTIYSVILILLLISHLYLELRSGFFLEILKKKVIPSLFPHVYHYTVVLIKIYIRFWTNCIMIQWLGL
jgi:hypothetical protein